jgi:hypothetical protein
MKILFLFYNRGLFIKPINKGPVNLSLRRKMKGLLISREEATEIGYPDKAVPAAPVAPNSFMSKVVICTILDITAFSDFDLANPDKSELAGSKRLVIPI